MLNKSINDLVRGLSLYHVWIYQAYHDVSSKYKRTALGSLWISGAMVATSLALAIIMGGIMKQEINVVLPFTMGGIMCFALFGYVLNDAPDVYISVSGIIRNHAYPFTYYTFESVARVFIVFLHNIVVFYIVLLVLRKFVIPDWTILPALVLVAFNALVWGGLVSMMAARFRDLRFLLPFLSQIIFFMTPVFWHPDNMDGWRILLIQFNPFYGLMEIVRSPLLGSAAPLLCWEQSFISLGVGAVLWLIFFSLYRGRIAFWV